MALVRLGIAMLLHYFLPNNIVLLYSFPFSHSVIVVIQVTIYQTLKVQSVSMVFVRLEYNLVMAKLIGVYGFT